MCGKATSASRTPVNASTMPTHATKRVRITFPLFPIRFYVFKELGKNCDLYSIASKKISLARSQQNRVVRHAPIGSARRITLIPTSGYIRAAWVAGSHFEHLGAIPGRIAEAKIPCGNYRRAIRREFRVTNSTTAPLWRQISGYRVDRPRKAGFHFVIRLARRHVRQGERAGAVAASGALPDQLEFERPPKSAIRQYSDQKSRAFVNVYRECEAFASCGRTKDGRNRGRQGVRGRHRDLGGDHRCGRSYRSAGAHGWRPFPYVAFVH